MHKAAEGGHVKVVNYLVTKGAKINVQDKNGVKQCTIDRRVKADFSWS